MKLENLERWRYYMKERSSPNSFIDWGFYYMMAASLQRRVWVGAEGAELFPNIYVVLVSDPGIGKGLVIDPVSDMLAYHKEERINVNKGIQPDVNADEINEMMMDASEQRYNPHLSSKIQNEKRLLLPKAPDAITFEALVSSTAEAIRYISYKDADGKTKIYSHSSIYFSLEEISSLFRKHTEDTVNFLMRAYVCKDYKYKTKTQGEASIKRCCLNLLGGTQPHFIQKLFGDELLTDFRSFISLRYLRNN